MICVHCNEPEHLELLEVWSAREFQIATCCEELQEEALYELEFGDREALLRRLNVEDVCGYELRRVADDDGHLVLDWQLDVRPIRQAEAKAFIRQHHEHNPPPAGDRFRAGCWNGPDLIAVVMAGRPVARKIDHTTTVEVNRLCCDRSVPDVLRWKACSTLYSWAAGEAFARGFDKVITYTLKSESGMSLRYARWKPEAETKGGSWNTPSRPREDVAPTEPKVRWTAPRKAA